MDKKKKIWIYIILLAVLFILLAIAFEFGEIFGKMIAN